MRLVLLAIALTALAAFAVGPAGAAAAPDGVASPDGAGDAVSNATNDGSPTSERADGGDACAPLSVDEPANPEEDRLGWENGCWHDESLAVTRSDGLNETELDAVVARSMARVEAVRELEFDRTVPVEVVSRGSLREIVSNRSNGTGTDGRLFHNAAWEALFVVGEDTDAVSVEQSTAGGGILGFYDPESDEIVVVSENETTPRMNEITLSQELFHALQDRKFDLTAYDRATVEGQNADNGIVEGDGNFVDYLYERRCGEEWDCLLPRSRPGGGGVNLGMWMVSYLPYSEGPELVRERYEAGGWDAVDEMYETPPDSTEQLIHHEKYPDEESVDVTVEGEPRGDWRRLDRPAGPDYEVGGEGGLFSMFGYATFQASNGCENPFASVVVTCLGFLNQEGGEPDPIDPYNYSHPVTDGWAGDRLVLYANGSSADTNETGYVWRTEWDSAAEAREFVDGYERLLAYRGAEAVGDRAGTYRIPDDRRFGDAFRVNRTGATAVLVNAPTVDALGEIRPRSGSADTRPTDGSADTSTTTAPATPTPAGTPATTADGPDRTASPTTAEPASGTDRSPTAGDGSGPGALVALVAVVSGLTAAARRAR